MKKIQHTFVALITVIAMVAASTNAIGFRGGGGHGGGGHFGGGGGHFGGGGGWHGGGHFGYGGASLYRGGGGYGGYGGYGRAYRNYGAVGTFRSFSPRSSVSGSGNVYRGTRSYSRPSYSGRRQFRGTTTGQARPTQTQVQKFLSLPKSGAGRVGAAAVGATAGAMALDRFSRNGSVAGLNAVSGHTPVKGTSFSSRVNPQTTQQLRNTYSQQYGNAFNRNWWQRHSYITNNYYGYGGWGGYGWGYWWGPATWLALSSWIPWNWGSPLYYDYGSNFYYDDGYVYLNGQRLCSAPEYYQQAVQIIDKTPKVTTDKDQWMPLGVFALTPEASRPTNMVLQLAINKEGVIQGTYFNKENDKAKPIKGMVDKESERAVWTFADKNKHAVIMETGIYNLTKDETGVLMHFGKEKTQEWLMIRLKEPPEGEQAAPVPSL
ncbi:MAG: hypothetical protein ACP5U1_04525 [Desulfomonilaceae bacterium]